MRSFVAPIVIVMLAGTAPAAAQSKTDKATSVGTITTQDTEAEMNTYTNNAHSEMRMWEQRLNDFNAKVKTSDTEAQKNTDQNLNSAWTETKSTWKQVVKVGLNEGTDGATDWDSAKVSFQAASQKLAVAWKEVNQEDK